MVKREKMVVKWQIKILDWCKMAILFLIWGVDGKKKHQHRVKIFLKVSTACFIGQMANFHFFWGKMVNFLLFEWKNCKKTNI